MENENGENVQPSDNFDERLSRKRSRSPSTSSASSSEESSPERKRSKSVSDMRFEFLSQQVTFLTNLITQKQLEPQACVAPAIQQVSDPVCCPIGDLGLRPPPDTVVTDSQQLKLSELSTSLKDPPFPKANEAHLAKLSQLQRFKYNDWYAIRFSEAQKKYLATPGFTELNINDELRRFKESGGSEDRLYLLERTYAALSNAILTQKDELLMTLQNLVDWSNDKTTTLTPKSLFEKIEQLFNKDCNYKKVTDDILQICCGRRADCIHMRRECILKQIPEEYHCGALQKIPPSEENLFDGDLLATYLQKIGGAEKLTPSLQTMHHAGPASSRNRSNDRTPKPSTSKQTGGNFFRGNSSGFKGKNKGHAKSSDNRPSSNKTKRVYKGKKPRSNSPARNNRA